MDVNVINERDINSTNANRLIHNRFPSVRYHKNRSGKYKSVDYNAIIEELNKFISSTLEAFNG